MSNGKLHIIIYKPHAIHSKTEFVKIICKLSPYNHEFLQEKSRWVKYLSKIVSFTVLECYNLCLPFKWQNLPSSFSVYIL